VATTSSEAVRTQVRRIDGLSIRYAESDPDREADALLLNPWPESVFAFSTIWSRLAEHAHLVAIDMPGFGQSERRDALLSPHAMGDFVARVADAFGLEHPHVVGPDVGSGAALFFAALHPGRPASLVVGSGGAAFPLQVTGALKDLIEAPDMEPLRALNPRDIVAGALEALERHELSDDVREDYLSSYEGDRFVESARYVRSYPTDLAALAELLPGIETPAQIIAGNHDTLVPTSNAEYLDELMPNSKLNLVDSGHFAWEDAADEYAALIVAWWRGGYRNVAS
jgi:pimeloyl-ACP methyl ester carboxylesterase